MARLSEKTVGEAVETSAICVGVLFIVGFFKFFLGFPLQAFGIIPRTLWGLVGIACSPLIHASPAHLMANAVPLFVLLTLLLLDKRYYPVRTLGLIWLASGLGTWLIGRPAVHIGASSIIYGLLIYLIASGFMMKSWRSAFVALLVLICYGGIIYGVLPQRGPVSWEGHLSGAVAGYWAALKNHD